MGIDCMPESPCVREGGRKTENSHLHTWRGVGWTDGGRELVPSARSLRCMDGTDGMAATTNDQDGEEDGEEEEDG